MPVHGRKNVGKIRQLYNPVGIGKLSNRKNVLPAPEQGQDLPDSKAYKMLFMTVRKYKENVEVRLNKILKINFWLN